MSSHSGVKRAAPGSSHTPAAGGAEAAVAAAAAGRTREAPNESAGAASCQPNKRLCVAAGTQQQAGNAPGSAPQQRPAAHSPAAEPQEQLPTGTLTLDRSYADELLAEGQQVRVTNIVLGRGATAVVLVGLDKEYRLWAVKVLNDKGTRPCKQPLSTTFPEDILSQEIRVAHLPPYHDKFAGLLGTGQLQGSGQQCLVSELHQQALNGLLRKQQCPLPTSRVQGYMQQLLEGVSLLHSLGVVHRDIKPQNLLLSANDTLRMCDFGCAAIDRQQQGSSGPARHYVVCGSDAYMAPELYRMKKQQEEAAAAAQKAAAAAASGAGAACSTPRSLAGKLAAGLQAAVAAMTASPGAAAKGTGGSRPAVSSYDAKIDVYSAVATGLVMAAGGYAQMTSGSTSDERLELFREQLRAFADRGDATCFCNMDVRALLQEPEAAAFFRAGLTEKPEQRPTAQQLLQRPWLAKTLQNQPVVAV